MCNFHVTTKERLFIEEAVAQGIKAPHRSLLAGFEVVDFRIVTHTDLWITCEGNIVANGLGNGHSPRTVGKDRRRLIVHKLARKREPVLTTGIPNLLSGYEMELISRGTSLGLAYPAHDVVAKYEIVALAPPVATNHWLACDGGVVMFPGSYTQDRYDARFILKPRANAGQSNVVTGTVACDAAQQEEYSPKPQSSGATSEGETMNKFIATIVSRPVKKDGETIPAAIVAELPAIVADSQDRARTAFTAVIARDAKLAHVLEAPEAYQIQVVHVAPLFSF